MIRIVDSSNAAEYENDLRQQFANRHTIFVEELGWTDYEASPTVERDEYDDEHAVYGICLDDRTKQVIGGIRFYPTTRPHMLSRSFAHLVEGRAVVSKPDVYEVTRSHLLPAHRNKTNYLELLCAIQEIGLHLGASGMTSIVRTLRLPIILETGLAVAPIGEPQLVDGESNIAVYYEIGEHILARMNKRRGTSVSVLEGRKRRFEAAG